MNGFLPFPIQIRRSCWKLMRNSRMGSLFLSATVGQGFQEASAIIKKTVPEIIRVFSTSACDELDESLKALKPVMDAMDRSRLESLLPIQEFQGKFDSGRELVKECPKTSNYDLAKKFRNAKEIDSILEWIGKFIKDTLLPNMAMIVMDLPCRLENLDTKLNDLASKIDQHIQKSTELRRLLFENPGIDVEQQEWGFCLPNTPNFLVGLDRMLMQLENVVLDANVSVVGITGSSGMGKSTLASALCHCIRIKDHFRKKVIYIHVSKCPNIMGILMNMWEQIVDDGQKPRFHNDQVASAHSQLQRQISSGRNQPTLVVLDDVWSSSDLQNLLFNGENYKTLVTTRHADIIRQVPSAYSFPLSVLQDEDALSLFCHYAFGVPDIPKTHDRELVKQVQVECKGLPVALRVIGSSMRGQVDSMLWKSAKNKLSRGETISPYHNELYDSLKKTSIDVLEDNAKYFLDLAAFPEGRTICANVLLDIWVYVHGMDWDNAFVLLYEFADRNLLTLNRDHWNPRIADGANGLYFSQHDVMRDLALYLVKQDNKTNCTRLCMPEKRDSIPAEWLQVHASKAKIVSIHTGTMEEEQWRQMEFPEAEALVLYFTAEGGYCIPTFLGTMKKLKVLIINNYSARRATLRGLNGFEELSHLKTLQIERLLVPPLYVYFSFLKSLEKLSLSLCEGLGDMSKLDEEKFFNFPGLLEFNVDHCSDLEELPRGICSSNCLKMLSVTNCHQLAKLPEELGKLGLLEVLCLRACARLTGLPHSIHSLQQLEILDISLCGSLKGFPDKFHELARLKKLDMRECRKLKGFCKTLVKLASLNRVICDTNNEQQLMSLSKANLTVVGFEVPFSLDWLYY